MICTFSTGMYDLEGRGFMIDPTSTLKLCWVRLLLAEKSPVTVTVPAGELLQVIYWLCRSDVQTGLPDTWF